VPAEVGEGGIELICLLFADILNINTKIKESYLPVCVQNQTVRCNFYHMQFLSNLNLTLPSIKCKGVGYLAHLKMVPVVMMN